MNTMSTKEMFEKGVSLLDSKEVIKKFNIGRSTLWKGVKDGTFPKPIRIGKRTTRWRSDHLQEYIDSCPYTGEEE